MLSITLIILSLQIQVHGIVENLDSDLQFGLCKSNCVFTFFPQSPDDVLYCIAHCYVERPYFISHMPGRIFPELGSLYVDKEEAHLTREEAVIGEGEGGTESEVEGEGEEEAGGEEESGMTTDKKARSIRGLPQEESIGEQYDDYEGIPGDITKCKYKGHMYNCQAKNFKSFPNGPFPKRKIFKLDLSYNKIRRISKMDLARMKTEHLRILNLSYNLISDIDQEAFKNMENLRKLDLSNNLLHSFDGFDFGQSLLHKLDLSGNPMTSLKGLRMSGKQTELALEETSLECNCDLLLDIAPLKRFITQDSTCLEHDQERVLLNLENELDCQDNVQNVRRKSQSRVPVANRNQRVANKS